MLSAIGIIVLTVVAMEGVAWAMHKYVMHGFLWVLHKSHHTKHKHVFELNDLFFVFYGGLATLLIMYGYPAKDFRLWIGVGITIYGALYLLVHDIFIHRRVKLFGKATNLYFKSLNIGHKIHHSTTGKEGSECFGMLWVAPKYFKIARKKSVPKQKDPEWGSIQ